MACDCEISFRSVIWRGVDSCHKQAGEACQRQRLLLPVAIADCRSLNLDGYIYLHCEYTGEEKRPLKEATGSVCFAMHGTCSTVPLFTPL